MVSFTITIGNCTCNDGRGNWLTAVAIGTNITIRNLEGWQTLKLRKKRLKADRYAVESERWVGSIVGMKFGQYTFRKGHCLQTPSMHRTFPELWGRIDNPCAPCYSGCWTTFKVQISYGFLHQTCVATLAFTINFILRDRDFIYYLRRYTT